MHRFTAINVINTTTGPEQWSWKARTNIETSGQRGKYEVRCGTNDMLFQVSIPCKKRVYRLYGKEGYSLVDIMTGENEPPPKVFCWQRYIFVKACHDLLSYVIGN